MTRQRWSVLRWALGIGILVLLIVGLGSGEVLTLLTRANASLAVLGIAGLTATHLLGAATWRLLCRLLGGVTLPWWSVVGSYYTAQGLGGITPANLGGDAYRIYALHAAGHGLRASLWPVVVQRATSYLALSTLAVIALLAIASIEPATVRIVLVGIVAAVLVTLVALLVLAAPAGLRRVRTRLVAIFAGQSAADDTDAVSPLTGRQLTESIATGFLLGLGFHATSVLLTYLLVVAVAPGPFSLTVLSAIVVARLALAVPLTPSGIGVQEGLLSLLFASLGMEPAAALAAMLIARIALVTTGIVGVVAFVHQGHSPASETSDDGRRVVGPRTGHRDSRAG